MSTTATLARPKRIGVEHLKAALEAVAYAAPMTHDQRITDDLPPRYLHRGQPACLIAKVLLQLGYTTRLLQALQQERPTGEIVTVGVQVAESRNPVLRRFDANAKALLRYVQLRQDAGEAWGVIVAEAFRRRWLDRLNPLRKPWLS